MVSASMSLGLHFVEEKPGEDLLRGFRSWKGVHFQGPEALPPAFPACAHHQLVPQLRRQVKAVFLLRIQAGMKIPQPHPNHSPTSQSSISLARCSPQRDILSSPDRSHGLILCSPSPPQLPPRKTAALQRLSCLFRNLCDQKHSSPIRGLLHFLKNLGDDWV